MRDGFRSGIRCLGWGHRRAGRRREPGRRGLLSGKELLFANALILLAASTTQKHEVLALRGRSTPQAISLHFTHGAISLLSKT
jgi:hypothetical protein